MKLLAKFVSLLFHPLFLLNFGLFSVFQFHPYYITKFYDNQFYTVSIFIAVNTLIMPILSIYLFKKFGFISDYSISNPKQRLLPYSVMVVMLAFTIYQLNKSGVYGLPLVFMAASALALLINILINFVTAISTHGIGAGGLIGLFLYLTLFEHISSFNILLILSFLIAGVASWSRLYLNAHSEKQLYSGLILGFAIVYGVCVSYTFI
jgi:hypothetical protein